MMQIIEMTPTLVHWLHIPQCIQPMTSWFHSPHNRWGDSDCNTIFILFISLGLSMHDSGKHAATLAAFQNHDVIIEQNSKGRTGTISLVALLFIPLLTLKILFIEPRWKFAVILTRIKVMMCSLAAFMLSPWPNLDSFCRKEEHWWQRSLILGSLLMPQLHT